MSVIAVNGVPMRWSVIQVVGKLKKIINGPFKPLNFQNNKHVKIAYIRLSEFLDPVQVVEAINNCRHVFAKTGQPFEAFIPDHVPDLPLAVSNKAKKFRTRGMPEMLEKYEVVLYVLGEILKEMQSKFPQLYNLNLKTNKKLINEIAKVIFERLKNITEATPEARENCFKMSSCYRRKHPHFGDFQLILSTLHKLQDAAGAPRMQLSESELARFEPKPYALDEIPFNTIQIYCKTYTKRVSCAIKKQIDLWEKEDKESGDENEARTRVRQEIQRLLPHMSTIVTQITAKYFRAEEAPYQRIRIYGEPFLPKKAEMHPFLSKYTGPSPIIRSFRMYNMLHFKVTQKNFDALLALDGTTLYGAKLVIRNDMPIQRPRIELLKEMAAELGAPQGATFNMPADEEEEDEDMEMDVDEDA